MVGDAVRQTCVRELWVIDTSATFDDLREAMTMLEETARIARRVFGTAHPTTIGIEHDLRVFRANAPPPRA